MPRTIEIKIRDLGRELVIATTELDYQKQKMELGFCNDHARCKEVIEDIKTRIQKEQSC